MKTVSFLALLLLVLNAASVKVFAAEADSEHDPEDDTNGGCGPDMIRCDTGKCQENCNDQDDHMRRRREAQMTSLSDSVHYTASTAMTSYSMWPSMTECVMVSTDSSGIVSSQTMATYNTDSSVYVSWSSGVSLSSDVSIRCTMPPTESSSMTSAWSSDIMSASSASMPASYSSMAASSSAMPPSYSSMADSSSMPPSYSSMAASSASMSPSYSSMEASSASMPQSYSSMEASSASMPPSYSSMEASSASMPPSYSSMEASSASMPPSYSSMVASSASMPPSYSSMEASSASMPPSYSSMADSSSMPPGYSSMAASSYTMAASSASMPSIYSSMPPNSASMPQSMASMAQSYSSMPLSSSMPPYTASISPSPASAAASAGSFSASTMESASSVIVTTAPTFRTQNQEIKIRVAGTLSNFLANNSVENVTRQVTTQIAQHLNVTESRITNVQFSEQTSSRRKRAVSQSSFVLVTFEITPATSSSEQTIAALESFLRNDVISGNFTLTDGSGNPITLDTTFFGSRVVVADKVPDKRRDMVPIIVGTVVGVLCLALIFVIIVVVILKTKKPKKHNSFVSPTPSPSASGGKPAGTPYGDSTAGPLPEKNSIDIRNQSSVVENETTPGTSTRPGSESQTQDRD